MMIGYVDAVVMAIAERDRLPVLTFDFEHLRATHPAHGFWQLVIDEHRYQAHLRSYLRSTQDRRQRRTAYLGDG